MKKSENSSKNHKVLVDRENIYAIKDLKKDIIWVYTEKLDQLKKETRSKPHPVQILYNLIYSFEGKKIMMDYFIISVNESFVIILNSKERLLIGFEYYYNEKYLANLFTNCVYSK